MVIVDVYDIGLGKKGMELLRRAAVELDNTPPRYTRIRAERINATMIRLIRNKPMKKKDIRVGDTIVYLHSENLGTRTWPYMVTTVTVANVISVWKGMVTTNRSHRPTFDKILCVI